MVPARVTDSGCVDARAVERAATLRRRRRGTRHPSRPTRASSFPPPAVPPSLTRKSPRCACCCKGRCHCSGQSHGCRLCCVCFCCVCRACFLRQVLCCCFCCQSVRRPHLTAARASPEFLPFHPPAALSSVSSPAAVPSTHHSHSWTTDAFHTTLHSHPHDAATLPPSPTVAQLKQGTGPQLQHTIAATVGLRELGASLAPLPAPVGSSHASYWRPKFSLVPLPAPVLSRAADVRCSRLQRQTAAQLLSVTRLCSALSASLPAHAASALSLVLQSILAPAPAG